MAGLEEGGLPPDAAKELQKEMSLRNEMSRGMYLSDLDRFKTALREIDSAKSDEEKELAREEAYHHFDEIKKQELGHLEFIADKHMSFEFAFPYDSRQGAVWFQAMRRDLEDTLEVKPEKGGFDGESRKWLENLYDAVVWGDGQYGVQEGLNMISWYYGGFDAMASGLPNMKLRITSTKLADAYAKDVRGPGSNARCAEGIEVRKGDLTAEKRTRTVQEVVGVGKDRKKITKEVSYNIQTKEPVENIRETGVEYHDEFFYWRHIVAAVAQYDYVNPSKEGLLKGSTLRKELEVKFVAQLFSEKDKNGNIKTVNYKGAEAPAAILNFYTMKDTKKNRQEYRNLMQALMQCNAREELKKCEAGSNADGSLNVDMTKLQLLLNRVDETKKAIAARERDRSSSFQDRMGCLVVKQGITFDIGSANAGPLSWQFEYKKTRDKRDVNGKVIPNSGELVRRMDFGGINQAGDWYTAEFPYMHNNLYDKTSRLRSKLILPTPDRYRKKQIQEKSPLEKPIYNYEEAKAIDPWACMDVLKLIAADDEVIQVGEKPDGSPLMQKAGEWRQQNKFRIDNDVRVALRENLWFQEIPFQIGTNDDKSPKFPLYPSFIPHRFKLSFFDHIKIPVPKDDEKDPDVFLTLGDKLRNGLKLSDVNFEDDLKEHQWDRWLVNLNMGERLLRFVAEPGDSRAQEAILNGPGTIKEALKRVGLHNRDSFQTIEVDTPSGKKKKSVGPAVFEIPLVSQMMILAAIKGNDRGPGLPHDLISKDIETESFQNTWENLLTDYVNMAKYMTPDTDETVGTPEFFNETLALTMAVTGNSVYRIALEGGTNITHDLAKVRRSLSTMLVNKKHLKKRNLENLPS